MQWWIARADPPHPGRHPAQAPWGVVVLRRLERDVVPEPFRLLVRVRVAPDVDEQRRVVDDRPRLLVEAQLFGQSQANQALPEDVLHRLAETEDDAERERRNELGKANLRGLRLHDREA